MQHNHSFIHSYLHSGVRQTNDGTYGRTNRQFHRPCSAYYAGCVNECGTHTHPFNGPFSGTTQVSRYQKGKPIWILLKQDSEWQWHQLGHMQVCTSLQTDNHANTHHSVFLQAGCPSCRPTNSVKALKAQ